MTTMSKTFGSYRVTLDTDMGDGATGCWIQKGSYSASLEAADAEGLVDSNDQVHEVPASTLAAIRKWAEANGY
jgi:hypothetical protein